jgi:hypothetical protein
MNRPILHVTNWASRKLHRGTVYTIMSAPRSWEWGAGRIVALCPRLDDLRDLHEGRLAGDTYRTRFEHGLMLDLGALVPGKLTANTGRPPHPLDTPTPIRDGDTLCCACARGKPCHRRWAAPWLHEAGWDVVLDGELWRAP